MNSIRIGVASVLLAAGMAAQAAAPAKTSGPAPAVVEGLVTQVPDGESLWITPIDKPAVLLQLNDIDAPESCQVYGEEARRALAELALNRRATAKLAGRDPGGRALARVMVDGADLSVRMVEEGHAWSVRSKWDNGPLVKQERMSRALNRGLHADGKAMLPREFRRLHGPCPASLPPVPSGPR